MKKFILLLLWSILSFGQASNEMVSYTQAQSLGFTLKAGQTHVTSNQCMTKSEALAKYNLSTSAMASYTDNQLVSRSAWITAVVSYIYFGDMTGYSTRNTACANATNHSLYYSASSFVQSGMVLYYDSNLTLPFNGNGQYYSIYPDYEFSPEYSGTINSSGSFSNIEDCAAPTVVYGHTLSTFKATTAPTVCGSSLDIIKYSLDNILGLGSQLYNEETLETVFVGLDRYRYCEKGTAVKINDIGEITSEDNCL